MRDRPVPSSILWLVALALLSIAVAVIAGGVIYFQTTQTAKTQTNAMTRGDWKRGRLTVAQYGCGSCHVIPGIAGANGKVGPDLTHIAQRTEIAGKLPNDPDALVRWLMHPQSITPKGGMPEQGISDAEARDIAAYLYSER